MIPYISLLISTKVFLQRDITRTFHYNMFYNFQLDGKKKEIKSGTQTKKKSLDTLVDEDDDDLPPLEVNYEIEKLSYFSSSNQEVSLSIKYATSTKGRNLIHGKHDSTGVMLWPASHLMCQYIAWHSDNNFLHENKQSKKKSEESLLRGNVVELGCGCGVVGIFLALHQKCSKEKKLVVCTDMDKNTLHVCNQNISLNAEKCAFDAGIDGYHSASLKTFCLSWGDENAADNLLTMLSKHVNPVQGNINTSSPTLQFDTIIAADIIYPATCGYTLNLLFQTIDKLLEPTKGRFLLSFVTRDAHRTPINLIEAASQAGYLINIIPSERFLPKCFGKEFELPPMMDAKLLVLTKNAKSDIVYNHNKRLGDDDCTVFPGLKHAAKRALEESSEEEWEPPFDNEEMD